MLNCTTPPVPVKRYQTEAPAAETEAPSSGEGGGLVVGRLRLIGLAPDLRGRIRDVGPLVTVSRRGLPAFERTLDDTKPFLARLEPYLR